MMAVMAQQATEVHRPITATETAHAFTIYPIPGGVVVCPVLSTTLGANWTARNWKRVVKQHLHDHLYQEYRKFRFFDLREPTSALFVSIRRDVFFDDVMKSLQEALNGIPYYSDRAARNLSPAQRGGLRQLTTARRR